MPLIFKDGTRQRETMFTRPKLVSKHTAESGIDADLARLQRAPVRLEIAKA
jgi:hypothetical protein